MHPYSLHKSFTHISHFIERKKILVVLDTKVQSMFPDILNSLFTSETILVHNIENAQNCKTLDSYNSLINFALSENLSQDDVIVGIGGGSLLDLVGFFAATFKRGISFIAYPTTLTAMVDAAFGGKNGLDIGDIKNSIGTFYFPFHVAVCFDFLSSLPESEIKNGMGEIIKYALTIDSSLLDEISVSIPIETHIERCIKNKLAIVEESIHRPEIRNILNAGHTVGHALESFFQKNVSHGECVAIGCLIEAIAQKVEKKTINQLLQLLFKYSFDLNILDKIDIDTVYTLMKNDKKNRSHVVMSSFKLVGNTLLPLSFSLWKESLSQVKKSTHHE